MMIPVYLVVCLWGSLAPSVFGESPTLPPGICMHQGKIYTEGQTVPDEDPCKFCTCTSYGHVECAISDCYSTECPNPVWKEGECCPTCPEGCKINGVHYDIGEDVPNRNPCESCVCSPNGKLACHEMMCALQYCENPVFFPDQCCPSCPPDEGCLVGDVYYDEGEIVATPDHCEFCHCTSGELMCILAICAPPSCDNAEIPLGGCCPVCPDGCYSDGVQYQHGERVYSPDPCQHCKCSSEEGVLCVSMACEAPNCPNPVRVHGQCCPECPVGCEVGNVHYDYGQVIPGKDHCERCVCEEHGPLCKPITCPPVECINPVLRKGECCPVCPKGPNCAFGRRLIPVGGFFNSKRGFTCSCRTEPWDPMATCQRSIPPKYAKKLLKKKGHILNPILALLLGNKAEP